jgi:hypothetical protein
VKRYLRACLSIGDNLPAGMAALVVDVKPPCSIWINLFFFQHGKKMAKKWQKTGCLDSYGRDNV